MQKLTLFVLFSLFCFQVTAYDYYVFAQELPSTICQFQSCSSAYMGTLPDGQLNIHGLWPQNDDGTWPQFCDQSTSYSDSQVSYSTLSGLNHQWNGLYSSSSTFRNHEWQRHGSCFSQNNDLMLSAISQTEKFLRQLSQVNPRMDAFFSAGIHVSNKLDLSSVIYSQSSWDFQSLSNAVSNKLGGVTQFSLECKQNYLSGIQVCVSLSFEPIDCQSLETNNQCPQDSTITIPSLN